MINPKFLFDILNENDINFFCGVPDSLLKDFCAYITDNTSNDKHIITANEGNAIGLATGYHLSTQKFPLVYMQNSGIGNAINPILSLADTDVYSIPMLLLIGWRGEPGIKDEPQHLKQGKVTLDLLKAMGVEYEILADNQDEAAQQIISCKKYLSEKSAPFAFVVRKQTFSAYKLQNKIINTNNLTREEAIGMVVGKLSGNDIIISTTGMISRELYEYREKTGNQCYQDFFTVGSMGHANHIALGIAIQKKDRRIICLDGDGALLMHMGSMAIIGIMAPANYIHVVFNNGAHDSVGGQPTVALDIDFPRIALACGYKQAFSISDYQSFDYYFQKCQSEGPVLFEIKVSRGARHDLGRPKNSPIKNKEAFMKSLFANKK